MPVIIARLGAIRTGAGEGKTVAELLHRRLSIDSISDIGHLGAIPSLVLLPQSLNRTARLATASHQSTPSHRTHKVYRPGICSLMSILFKLPR
jgi:hypothetical protein